MRGAERLTVPFAYHGEGPFWDVRTGRLLCVDVYAADVVAVDPSGGVERFSVPSRAATVVRRRTGSGFVVGTERGVVLADEGLRTFETIAELIDDPAVRTNDGGCDTLGGFVIGTMASGGRRDRGSVYRVAPDRTVTELLAPVSISNGVQWSADGAQVYYIDTPTRRVDVFDVDPRTGAWSGRRPHIRIDDGHGFPDGMAIDEAGGVWIAMWGGGTVNHYDAGGRLVERIRVPGVTQVSACAFGGDDRNLLFITTSREDLTHSEPEAGAVFVVPAPVRGAALAEFAG